MGVQCSQRWLQYLTCPQPVVWQGDTDGSLRNWESVFFQGRILEVLFYFMWWKADATSLAILINAVAFLAAYCARADRSASRVGALPEHLPGNRAAGNSELARAAKFPFRKHKVRSQGTRKPMCASCKMVSSLIRIIKTFVSPLKYTVGLMSGVCNSKCRYNVIFCHAQPLQTVRWADWSAAPATAYGWDNKRRFRIT